ncbi:MAG: sporulation protein YunB, partial [Lysinibacillus sp.]
MQFRRRKKMYFVRRKRGLGNLFVILLTSLLVMVGISIYVINMRLMPTYLEYAEVQTHKVASYVVNKAINSRTTTVLDVNEIIVDLPTESKDMITTK